MARDNIHDALVVSSDVFFNALAVKRRNLLDKVRALSSDYAFKPVANTNEHQTVLSALLSYQERVEADVTLLLSFEGQVIADTLHPLLNLEPFSVMPLLDKAKHSEYGEADLVAFIDQQAYLLVTVPLFSPEPSHWVVMGFKISDRFALSLQNISKSQVSILFSGSNQQWQVLASTQPKHLQSALELSLSQQIYQAHQNIDLLLDQQKYVSMILPVQESNKGRFIALIQRSLAKALEPYEYLHWLVLSLFMSSLCLFILGGLWIAKRITQPVTILTQGAAQIEQGHYDLNIKVGQEDELGRLAQQFNAMAKGLEERGKVRSLLGKVVSPEIAQELMKNGVELGGEERMVTCLFSDIRNFTQLCEVHSAKQIIKTLNTLLTCFTKLIDSQNGVVDKYIGDAVMALFGVPVKDEKQAHNAVMAGLTMVAALSEINQQLKSMDLVEVGLGIGINTGKVIAGNMGSASRLNYTVIGDGVNLASRLEGLTKFYGVPILVSEATQKQCPKICFREIATVRVKGKKKGIKIYQPMALKEALNQEQLNELENYQQALNLYQQQQWAKAYDGFHTLNLQYPEELLYQVYLKQVQERRHLAFDDNWDGVFTHLDK